MTPIPQSFFFPLGLETGAALRRSLQHRRRRPVMAAALAGADSGSAFGRRNSRSSRHQTLPAVGGYSWRSGGADICVYPIRN
ncbi:hypothetical protein IF1G_10972 [Cordyceps javanica]|uniref:Uncharacterized protein n=1 Tax=Cordyceps javanica TaxID=43265 RepID=A0A545ULJ4_9HYPO|nr:hypothetical protein IF1G_10972 [Cordyceps javanica]